MSGEAKSRREHDLVREDAVYQAQEWTPVLRAIRAMPSGWSEFHQLLHAMYPPPLGPRGHIDGRTRAAREWHRHYLAVMRVWLDLIAARLVEIVIPADGLHPDLFRVSETGNRWLAEHDSLTGGEPD
jgi:hypothetical protein